MDYKTCITQCLSGMHFLFVHHPGLSLTNTLHQRGESIYGVFMWLIYIHEYYMVSPPKNHL